MSRKPIPNGNLVHDLAGALGGKVLAGETCSGEIRVGDLVAEVTVTFRRHVDRCAELMLRAGALATLDQHPVRATHCNCRTQAGSDCDARVSAAVAYEHGAWGTTGTVPGFLFVCGRHLKHHDLRPDIVLGSVSLSERQLAPAIARAEAETARWRRREQLREALEERLALRVKCPYCGANQSDLCTTTPPRRGTAGPHRTIDFAHLDRRDKATSLYAADIRLQLENFDAGSVAPEAS